MTTKIKCPACKGSGFIGEFSHIKGGVCYQCGGKGEVSETAIPKIETQIKWNTIEMMEINRLFTETEIEANVAWAIRQFHNGKSVDAIREEVRKSVGRRIEARRRRNA